MKTYHIRLLAVPTDNGDRIDIDSFMQSELPIGAVDMTPPDRTAPLIFTYSHPITEGSETVYVYRQAMTITTDEFCSGVVER